MRIPGGPVVGIGLGLNPPQNKLTISSQAFGSKGDNLQVVAPPNNQGATPTASPLQNRANIVPILIAFFAFLIILKVGSEHEKSGMQPQFAKIGAWSFITTGLMAMLFIVGSKAIVAKMPDKPSLQGIRYVVLAA